MKVMSICLLLLLYYQILKQYLAHRGWLINSAKRWNKNITWPKDQEVAKLVLKLIPNFLIPKQIRTFPIHLIRFPLTVKFWLRNMPRTWRHRFDGSSFPCLTSSWDASFASHLFYRKLYSSLTLDCLPIKRRYTCHILQIDFVRLNTISMWKLLWRL